MLFTSRMVAEGVDGRQGFRLWMDEDIGEGFLGVGFGGGGREGALPGVGLCHAPTSGPSLEGRGGACA